MNESEYFLFKVFPCKNKQEHDINLCYFNHSIEDTRRTPLSLREYILNFKVSNDDKLYGFNSKDNKLNYYSEHISINKYADKELFKEYPPCLNKIEYCYHINRYKTRKCVYKENNMKCPLGNLCYNIHKKISKESLIREFINKNLLTNNKVFINLKDIIVLYKSILDMPNKYISQQAYNELYTEMYSYFSYIEAPPLIPKTKLETYYKEKIKGKQIEEYYNIKDKVVFLSMSLPKKEEIIKLVYGMLNSSDGIMIYGADVNKGTIEGISMNRKERDFLSCWIDQQFENILIQYNNISFEFSNLFDTNQCIFVIEVKRIVKPKLYQEENSKKYYIIKDSIIEKKGSIVSIDDIKSLNTKEYITLTRKKLIDYYTYKK